jgi:hypothetical protein
MNFERGAQLHAAREGVARLIAFLHGGDARRSVRFDDELVEGSREPGDLACALLTRGIKVRVTCTGKPHTRGGRPLFQLNGTQGFFNSGLLQSSVYSRDLRVLWASCSGAFWVK